MEKKKKGVLGAIRFSTKTSGNVIFLQNRKTWFLGRFFANRREKRQVLTPMFLTDSGEPRNVIDYPLLDHWLLPLRQNRSPVTKNCPQAGILQETEPSHIWGAREKSKAANTPWVPQPGFKPKSNLQNWYEATRERQKWDMSNLHCPSQDSPRQQPTTATFKIKWKALFRTCSVWFGWPSCCAASG